MPNQLKFVVGAECIIEHKNKFLIIKRPKGVHAGGLLSFPGGGFEIVDGEKTSNALAETAKREVLEEVGLNLQDPINYVTSSYFVDSNNNHVVDAIFHCKLEKTVIDIKPSAREVPEYYWLTYNEVISHVDCPEWIHKYLDILCK